MYEASYDIHTRHPCDKLWEKLDISLSNSCLNDLSWPHFTLNDPTLTDFHKWKIPIVIVMITKEFMIFHKVIYPFQGNYHSHIVFSRYP